MWQGPAIVWQEFATLWQELAIRRKPVQTRSNDAEQQIMKIQRPFFIGVVHLKPLPGSPRYAGSMNAVVDAAAADARALATGGVDAVVVENFGDVPFTAGRVAAETVAGMAVAGAAVREQLAATKPGIPHGFNVLRNDVTSGLGLCAAADGAFVRVNVHTGAMVTDQGLIQGGAFETLRLRRTLAPNALIFADVHVKHASPLGGAETLEGAARDCHHRGLADALIVSGTGTGAATPLDDVRRVRAACPDANILIGSGSTDQSAAELLKFADGLIVGTWLKVDGVLANPIDPERVARLRSIMDQAGAGEAS